jgi:aerotolerance regulator-like protein/VWA domain-containing protein
MNWLALSPVEIAVVWAGLAAAALWLYLHHRRPQHRKVSTLRFWASVQPISQPRRRKLREPWAFLAQILFLLFLVLALANPRWGTAFEGRSVAIVLDTSIWSQARPAGEPPWIDQERAEAIRLLDSLPGGDRVLLLRAEADAPPILPFTTDRGSLRRAIQDVQPSSVAGDLPRALEMGRAALGGARRGLLVYVGPGLVDMGQASSEQARSLEEFRAEVESPNNSAGQPQFLMRLVGDWASVQNRGITRLSFRRDTAQPDRWRLLTQLKNYGTEKADVVLAFSVNGQPIGQRKLSLAPQTLASAEDEFTWDQGGTLQAEITPSDALRADDKATVNLPTFRTVRVAVIARETSPFAADLLSVLSSNPYVRAQIASPELAANISPDVAVYQGVNVPAQPKFNSIWFLSGAQAAGSRPVRVSGWNLQHSVTRWVRTHDVSVRNPAALKVEPGDTVLAYSEGDPPAPLILAREQNGRRILIVGFNPHDSNFPLESAFPLLMAGSVEWMTHSVDDFADSFSTGEIDLPGPASKIIAPAGKEVPFARMGAGIHFFALETGMYKIVSPGGETDIAVNPPALPAQRVQPTSAEVAEVEKEFRPPAASGMWRWLVLLAILALWLEWLLYYSARERQRVAEVREPPADQPLPDLERELEQQEEAGYRNPNFVGR